MALPVCPHCDKRYGYDIYELPGFTFSLIYCRRCGKAIGPVENSEVRKKNMRELVRTLRKDSNQL